MDPTRLTVNRTIQSRQRADGAVLLPFTMHYCELTVLAIYLLVAFIHPAFPNNLHVGVRHKVLARGAAYDKLQ